MKREILFKAQRADGEGWVEGDLLNSQTFGTSIRCKNGMDYTVDPETVCQYTGLNDKNGVKIFEGDILSSTGSKWTTYYDKGWFIGVAFEENESWDSFDLEHGSELTEREITGNIHDK